MDYKDYNFRFKATAFALSKHNVDLSSKKDLKDCLIRINVAGKAISFIVEGNRWLATSNGTQMHPAVVYNIASHYQASGPCQDQWGVLKEPSSEEQKLLRGEEC